MFDLTEQQETTGEVQEKVQDGDILKLSWKGMVENSERVVDQTDNTVVVVGKGNVILGIEEILPGMQAGETKKVVISPEKGHGKRDASQMQVISLRRFKKQNIDPQPGMRLRIQNRTATIRRVRGGRVTVDFNHPLAGRTLDYEVNVEEILREPDDIVKAFIEKHRYLIEGEEQVEEEKEEFPVSIEQDTVKIHLPQDEKLLFNQNIQIFKLFIASEINTNLEGISKVQYIETYVKSEESLEELKELEEPLEESFEEPLEE